MTGLALTSHRQNYLRQLAFLPMALVVLIYLASMAWTLLISLTQSRTLPNFNWAGFAQYQRLFENERWLTALQNLAWYALWFLPLSIVLGTLLAVALDQQKRWSNFWRALFLYPYAMSFIATGVVWQWLLHPELGLNHYLASLGLPEVFDWLIDTDRVMYAIVAATIWQSAGFVMVILLAALRGVDSDLWRVARLDKIPTWRVYLSVILPMLKPAYLTVFLLLATATVKLFDAVEAMTQGGPGSGSVVPAKFIMDHLFGRANLGLASAAAVSSLLSVIILLLGLYSLAKRAQHE